LHTSYGVLATPHIRSDLKGVPVDQSQDMGIAANWGNMRLSGLPDHSLTLQL
jgi:hypothetical protein